MGGVVVVGMDVVRGRLGGWVSNVVDRQQMVVWGEWVERVKRAVELCGEVVLSSLECLCVAR